MKTVKSNIVRDVRRVFNNLWPQLLEKEIEAEVDHPQEVIHGDYSTNVALRLASELGESPMVIGNKIITGGLKIAGLERAEVVPPGFINFYLNATWLGRQVRKVLDQGSDFASSNLGKNQKVQVEFISANPTGPLHVGNGRGAFTGDALANVFDKLGYKVQREYYVNDIGKQVDRLAESVTRRYLKQQGISVDYPDYCYKGKYIDQLAKELNLHKYKLTNINLLKSRIRYRALQMMIKDMKKTVTEKLKIKFDNWFSEKSLYKSGAVDQVLTDLKKKDLLYKKDGAIWVKTSKYGDDKDRVVVKASEDQTYFLSDIAYLWNKLEVRKFDKVIDIWGADHHGYVNRMLSMTKALDHQGKFDIIIVQLVRLMEGGVEIRMAKRTGTYVTLDELVSEVGLDATRFFFLMHAFDTHMDFDMTLAKKKSDKNPVYYVQYAHARICSIINKVAKETKQTKKKPKKTEQKKIYLREGAETALAKMLLRFPEVLEEVVITYQVHKLPNYCRELASSFHDFYTQCRVIEAEGINWSRVRLIKATQIVLEESLRVMGISAPKKM
ncbi:MAG: arginine--tRNA ligase [Patescibacteria group bacterium]